RFALNAPERCQLQRAPAQGHNLPDLDNHQGFAVGGLRWYESGCGVVNPIPDQAIALIIFAAERGQVTLVVKISPLKKTERAGLVAVSLRDDRAQRAGVRE